MDASFRAWENYGPIIAGRDYRVVAEGIDWYGVMLNGRLIHVFKWVFEQG